MGAKLPQVLVINGPNLNLLGTREPGHYGVRSLDDISAGVTALAGELGADVDIFQSNAEHELVGRVQAARGQADFIIINPAAFTHTSVALRDALLAVDIPFIELHLSNVHAREEFRAHSYFSDIAVGVISGLGPIGYELALRAAHDYLSRN
ncbi:MAG: type II 3-dehydroquinate dehydratase [Gammaproteobacteria bacterium]|nr:type II 3-dehydroquinate dehydratase [Gammaproteobacteria bacterium]